MSEVYSPTDIFKTLFSTYPPEEFKTFVCDNSFDKVKVYVDFKNATTGFYVQSVIENILENARAHDGVESSTTQAVIYHLNWWKSYFKELGLPVELFMFSDIGRSAYHREIRKEYKSNREIGGTTLDLNDGEPIEIRNKNMKFAEKLVNRLSNCYFILLDHLESDFIPYYLITRKFKNEENTLHVICSNDRDMFQILGYPNTCMIYSIKGNRNFLTPETVLQKYSGIDKKSIKSKEKLLPILNNLDINYLSACMAITGDVGDDVPGIKGIGEGTVLKMFSDMDLINTILGTPNDIVDRVRNNNSFLKEEAFSMKTDKLWDKVKENHEIVTNAFKLISYECLSRWFENIDNLNMKKSYQYINQILTKEKVIADKDFVDVLKQLPDLKLKKENVIHLLNMES
ncbi:MAG: hypothetical protein ACOCQD_02690 [archaeon]